MEYMYRHTTVLGSATVVPVLTNGSFVVSIKITALSKDIETFEGLDTKIHTFRYQRRANL